MILERLIAMQKSTIVSHRTGLSSRDAIDVVDAHGDEAVDEGGEAEQRWDHQHHRVETQPRKVQPDPALVSYLT